MGKLGYERLRQRRSGVALSKGMNTPQFGYILGKGFHFSGWFMSCRPDQSRPFIWELHAKVRN